MTTDELKGEMDRRFDELKGEMDRRFDELKDELKVDAKRRSESLAELISQGFARIDARFETQAARLDRHAALWQVGGRWSARMDNWAEQIDQVLETKDRQIADIQRRIDKLEDRKGQ